MTTNRQRFSPEFRERARGIEKAPSDGSRRARRTASLEPDWCRRGDSEIPHHPSSRFYCRCQNALIASRYTYALSTTCTNWLGLSGSSLGAYAK